MRRTVLLVMLLLAGWALAEDKPPAPSSTGDAKPAPRPVDLTDACGSHPDESTADPLRVPFCWNPADAEPPSTLPAKKPIAGDKILPPKEKVPGAKPPAPPGSGSKKSTKFVPEAEGS